MNIVSQITHCGPVIPYGDLIWINIASGNGVLSDGTKPLPEAMLTNHQWGLTAWEFENDWMKIIAAYPRGQWVKHTILLDVDSNAMLHTEGDKGLMGFYLGHKTS